MNLHRSTAATLRIGMTLGVAMIVIGLVLDSLSMGDTVLWAGITVLIASPFLGVLTSATALLASGDRRWGAVALVLIVIISVGIVLSM